MSKGRNKYKWANGGNEPRHGPVAAVECTWDVISPEDYTRRQAYHWTWDSSEIAACPARRVDAYHKLSDGQLFDLMALGYTGQEIQALQDMVNRCASGGPDRIFYRHQARKRNKPVFGYNRLYKKSHELGPKRLDGTVVWMRSRGFLWPFPEVGDERQ